MLCIDNTREPIFYTMTEKRGGRDGTEGGGRRAQLMMGGWETGGKRSGGRRKEKCAEGGYCCCCNQSLVLCMGNTRKIAVFTIMA